MFIGVSSMRINLALAGILVTLSSVALAHSLSVPFFRDDAPPLGDTTPTSGSAGIISAYNTSDRVVEMHVVYSQMNNDGEPIFQQSRPFQLGPRQAVSWRPIQNDPAEGLGLGVPNLILGLGNIGSADIVWLDADGGPGTLVGRYAELSASGAFAHVLFEK